MPTHSKKAWWIPTLIAALAACAFASPAMAQTPLKSEGELVISAPGGSTLATYEKAMTPWAKENGIKLVWIEGNQAAAFARIRSEAQRKSGSVDIVMMNDQSVNLARAQSLLATLDPALVTNEQVVLKEYAFPVEAYGKPPAGVRFFLAPFGIIYNTEIFKTNGWVPPTSWLDMYDPKYAKCLIPVAPSDGTMYQGVLNKINSGDYLNFDKTAAEYRKIAKDIPAFVATTSQSIDMLQRGIGCISVAVQGRAFAAIAQGAPIEFVFPKEGVAYEGGALAIPKNAPHPIAAQLGLNAFLSVEIQKIIMEVGFFTPVNPGVKKTDSGLAARLLIPSEMSQMNSFFIPMEAYDRLDDWSRKWQEIASSK